MRHKVSAMRRSVWRAGWFALLSGGVVAAAVVLALIVTLPGVQPGDDIDGLNYLFQVPLALPWALVFRSHGDGSPVAVAWDFALMGLANAAILFVLGGFIDARTEDPLNSGTPRPNLPPPPPGWSPPEP
jgi:hypothetical protein